jgi:hypothetical protein
MGMRRESVSLYLSLSRSLSLSLSFSSCLSVCLSLSLYIYISEFVCALLVRLVSPAPLPNRDPSSGVPVRDMVIFHVGASLPYP